MLRKSLLPLLALALPAFAYEPITLPVIPSDPAIEKKSARPSPRMTLDEK